MIEISRRYYSGGSSSSFTSRQGLKTTTTPSFTMWRHPDTHLPTKYSSWREYWNDRSRFDERDREREDTREYEPADWYPDRYRDEPQWTGPPEWPFDDFNYGP